VICALDERRPAEEAEVDHRDASQYNLAWSSPVTRRFGIGPTIVWTRVGAGLLSILVPIAGGPPLVAAAFLFVPQLFGDGLHTVSQIDQLTLRQQVTPALTAWPRQRHDPRAR